MDIERHQEDPWKRQCQQQRHDSPALSMSVPFPIVLCLSSGIFSQVSVQARRKEEVVILIRVPTWPVLTRPALSSSQGVVTS